MSTSHEKPPRGGEVKEKFPSTGFSLSIAVTVWLASMFLNVVAYNIIDDVDYTQKLEGNLAIWKEVYRVTGAITFPAMIATGLFMTFLGIEMEERSKRR